MVETERSPVARPARRATNRSPLRAVAMPTEHGGWGLTTEPGLLGLLIVPSIAGGLLAVAALVAFVARTPSKLVAVDVRRGRWTHRTTLAAAVAAGELAVLVLLVGVAVRTGDPFWWPFAAAVPFIAVEAWFEVRSRGRRLAPELAGAIGVSSVAAAVVVSGGGDDRLAAAAWLVLAARAVTSIPHVRSQIARLHGRPDPRRTTALADAGAVALALGAVAFDPSLALGAAAVVAVIVVQRATDHRPVPRPAVIGATQMAMGFGVVAVAALGAHIL